MKLCVILVLPVLLWGCSKEPPTPTGSSKAPQSPALLQQKNSNPVSLPFSLIVVENEEAKEKEQIKTRETALLAGKDYASLDQMAHEYRQSKACHPNGLWKLNFFYVGFELDDDDPEALWQERLSALRVWTEARPKSVTAQVAYSHFLTDYAWKARGSGYANTVSDEGWKLFSQRLQEAGDGLKNLGGLDEQCPHRWIVLSRIALGLSAPKPAFESLFQNAIKSTPGYTGYYYRQAIYLLPRWFGDEGEWEDALATGADKIVGDEGDLLYARVVWLMQEYGVANSNVFKECKLSSARVDKGFAIIQKQFPESLSVKSKRAYFACLAGDQKTARALFDSLDGKVDMSVWKTEEKFRRFAGWAYGI